MTTATAIPTRRLISVDGLCALSAVEGTAPAWTAR